ncbi:MAG: energy transducer TonB [Hydrogenophaga sp.]|uniref:energy transducer TonB family protein n=1 Tax=Hydrogenophaga sp. TaxID=1904254 RepID=UPI0027376257|nr:energy transducer TonB [Hydrogenophaga sp.]MDP3626308.1 energy transducer TonB [Hydrogenophaga sp.]
MQHNRDRPIFAVVLVVALHALALTMALRHPFSFKGKPEPVKFSEEVLFMEAVQPPPDKRPAERVQPAPAPAPAPAPPVRAPLDTSPPPPADKRPPATMDAPPAPTAEAWAFAARYPLKNSKGYRHNWGQQVRSMMGTAVEGPDQGSVRFRIEIAPDGRLAGLDTLWTTSASVERRAREAVEQMPPLPPTPNGKPLIFEKTITFDAWTADAPPLYKNDCEPDPVQHGNRFVWDGRSPQVVAEQAVAEKLDPAAYAECLKLLPRDSIEAEAASDERQQKQWASPTLGR